MACTQITQPLNAATSRHNCHVVSQMIIRKVSRKVNSSLKEQGGYFRMQNTIALHGVWPLGFYSLTFVGVGAVGRRKATALRS